MMSTAPGLPAALGRPRDSRLNDAILAATSELLAAVGYSGLSIAAVAERAGTTKATIYRRWPSKAHLVHEAAFPSLGDAAIPTTGDIAADVHQMVLGSIELFSQPEVRAALPGLMAEVYADPPLHAALLERFHSDVWLRFRQSIATAIADGTVRDDVDADDVIELIAGSALMAVTLRPPSDLDDRWVERLADLVLKGISQ